MTVVPMQNEAFGVERSGEGGGAWCVLAVVSEYARPCTARVWTWSQFFQPPMVQRLLAMVTCAGEPF